MGATTVLVSVEEYLKGDYSPDVDYVDGELQERNMGEGQHSTVQKFFIAFLRRGRSNGKLSRIRSSGCRRERLVTGYRTYA